MCAHDVGDLGRARLSRGADLDDDLRAGLALEVGTAAHDNGPDLADKAGAGRDGECLRNIVDTVVEEEDLAAAAVRVERVLDDSRVVLQER